VRGRLYRAAIVCGDCVLCGVVWCGVMCGDCVTCGRHELRFPIRQYNLAKFVINFIILL
jgi:hypothetical protein